MWELERKHALVEGFAGICHYWRVSQKPKHERREGNKLAEHQGEGDLEAVKSRDEEKQEAVQ